MLECNVNNIKKTFGADLIFENISFSVQSNERVGLIGPNGSGKTTILKILTGQLSVNEGDITFKKGTNVGYLDQIPNFSDDVLVETIIRSAKQAVFDLKTTIDELLKKLETVSKEESEKLLEKYTQLVHTFEQMNGYLVETSINKVCTGLNITTDMRNRPFSVLSGGEKTRVMLAKILLENPSILLLDEPSNHLDLESIEWLETYLKEYQGSVLIVSHDRYFLDNVCQKIVELSINRAIIYHGNYSYYLVERERRFLLELKAYLAQEKQTKRMEEQIKRYRVWGEMRDSDKMFKRAKELERRLDKVERLDKPVKDNPKLKLKTTNTSRSGKRVLEARGISKQFQDVQVFNKAHIELIYQDRLCILGSNGSGKTTLIKILLDDFNKEDSVFKWGTKLKLGYLPQDVVFEDDTQSIIEYFTKKHNVNQAVARRELAKALFIRDDVFKKINMLSGGEKSKLMLCSLAFDEVNIMILDEPTNHLDIDSRETIEEMLLAYEGTILFVSHDRYFIKKIASRIGEINNLNITYYEGDFTYYKIMKKRTLEKTPTKEEPKPKHKKTRNVLKENDIIKAIEAVEDKLHTVEQKMHSVGHDNKKLMALYEEKDELIKEQTALYQRLDE